MGCLGEFLFLFHFRSEVFLFVAGMEPSRFRAIGNQGRGSFAGFRRTRVAECSGLGKTSCRRRRIGLAEFSQLGNSALAERALGQVPEVDIFHRATGAVEIRPIATGRHDIFSAAHAGSQRTDIFQTRMDGIM